jgi:hypothetical protein
LAEKVQARLIFGHFLPRAAQAKIVHLAKLNFAASKKKFSSNFNLVSSLMFYVIYLHKKILNFFYLFMYQDLKIISIIIIQNPSPLLSRLSEITEDYL